MSPKSSLGSPTSLNLDIVYIHIFTYTTLLCVETFSDGCWKTIQSYDFVFYYQLKDGLVTASLLNYYPNFLALTSKGIT